MGVRHPQWPKEDEIILKEMVGRGMSARYISETMGRTRNAVIGKARRMGLDMAGSQWIVYRKRPSFWNRNLDQ